MTKGYSNAARQLEASGLRPTRQRLALAKLLLESGPRHVTAEEIFREARASGIPLSLATVYNTLHQFTQAGLISEVVAGSGQSWFDTRPDSHWHYIDSATGAITDDARIRALVSETPLADHEFRDAARHSAAMARHRDDLVDRISRLESEQDALLDKLSSKRRS